MRRTAEASFHLRRAPLFLISLIMSEVRRLMQIHQNLQSCSGGVGLVETLINFTARWVALRGKKNRVQEFVMQIFISKVPPFQEKVRGHLNSSPVSVEHGVTDSWGITSNELKYSTKERNSLSLADMSTDPSICLFRELAALKAHMIHHNQSCPARRLLLSLLFCWLGSFKVHADMIMLGHVWAHQDEIGMVWKPPPPPSPLRPNDMDALKGEQVWQNVSRWHQSHTFHHEITAQECRSSNSTQKGNWGWAAQCWRNWYKNIERSYFVDLLSETLRQ